MGLNTTCPVPAGAQDYGVRGTAWIPLVWSAAACSITTIAIALSLVVLHLRRYRAPREQRQIIRIVFCVIVYAVIAFFEVASYEVAQYIDPLGDLYEAFGLCALYLLFLQYAAPSGTFANDDILSAARAAEETTVSFDWVRVGYIFVFQYPITEIFCVILIESTEATGTYCSYSLYPYFGHIWVEIIQSLGIGACVIAILVFRGNMKQRMKVRRGLAKLVCFKIIVFIRFAQAWVFSLLLQYNVIKTSPTFSYNDILWGIPGLATCAEMVLFSLGFWYAFSSTEYGSNAKPRDSPLPLGKALLDVINPMDLISGIARIFPLWGEIHRSGDWAQWRAAIPINRQIRKYRNKKRAGGNVRYEEVRGEGTEELKMPKQSHSRSGSDAFDVEDTPTMGMGGQTLYQPPSGSPPDDASSSLMPEGSLRASSQGQWNGRRYDRSPSPPRGRNPEGMAGYEVV
ncbi:hypothetical protein LTR91_003667 [Friedmanniomyces endolithicus]|uniref:Uncharacterized protein n=1 Tax=Friedmanniomyces endolithicus TaxID=329885 RepID=A0AAN6KWF5_9PEZI|nr:hypothetical protein LTR94_013367 [Friedmanniomyces endolithicus]KAK0782635.1 hypothetical protein LTR59_012107 [Friedmanniomyces endolithicus]KAK0791360.1 hypothetical protein LTR38_010261 [Friedmanniomyces endolithicus]KAK0793933.1 hypothetical protein LTR75_010999 [Friedmanniomyces endolithicus]KAK0853530.1 hypothetical protein LTR03_002794 [Friedmanniomyces endolithicus]